MAGNENSGFATHPQNINTKGRPPLGQSMTELMREFLDGVEEGQKVTRKQQLIRKIALLAYKDGDLNAIKMIWNYIDGMPNQKTEITGEGGGSLEISFVRKDDEEG